MAGTLTQGMFAGHLAGAGSAVGTGARMENTVSGLGLTVEHTAVLRVRWLYGRLGRGRDSLLVSMTFELLLMDEQEFASGGRAF